ncbi:MAG: metallophosphoesterase family protein [Acutalibacteraceae bacterium]
MQTLKFSDGKFKIMQIADVQENALPNPDTIRLIRLAIEKEKPDLVVFTGDQIKGYSSSFQKDTLNKIESLLHQITEPIREYHIPFAVTFGNHDRDSGVPNKEQMKLYQKLDGCLIPDSRDPDDPGTFSIRIQDSQGKNDIFCLYIIDSNAKDTHGNYAPVTKEQIEWYRKERDRIQSLSGRYLPALVFQHIPLPEYYKAIQKCSYFSKGRVEAFGSRKNEYYKLYDDSAANGGFMLESPAVPEINNGEFDAFKEKGDVLGVYVGHDHNNSFVKKVDGIDLGYTQGAGFSTYGPGKNRGVRVFELNEETPAQYHTYTVTMNDLCDYKASKPFLEFILSHAPSSVAQVKSTAKRLAVSAVTIGSVYIGVRRLLKK